MGKAQWEEMDAKDGQEPIDTSLQSVVTWYLSYQSLNSMVLRVYKNNEAQTYGLCWPDN